MNASPGPNRPSVADAAPTLDDLRRSLQDECDALATGDAQGLAAAVERKQDAVTRLAALAAADRRRQWPAELLQVAVLNLRNAQLLAPRMMMNRARLQVLAGAGRGDTVYAADGSSAATQGWSTRPGARA